MTKTVLITGASSGFGLLTANSLLEKGYTVVASMRSCKDKNKEIARKLESQGAHIVEIDVRNDDSVEQGVAEAEDKTGGMDVVVNNAGLGVLGLQENFTPEDFKELFDINVFGVQRINRAVLPEFRRKQRGLIVYISSVLGRIALPFYGPYNASKWALEAMAENYRVELSGFGIDSVIVEPGGFATSFMHKLLRPSDKTRNRAYGPLASMPEELFKGFEQNLKSNPLQNPQLVADAVINLIEMEPGTRPTRTLVDNMGMGDALRSYNESLNQITGNLYKAFGMEDMLKLKVTELNQA